MGVTWQRSNLCIKQVENTFSRSYHHYKYSLLYVPSLSIITDKSNQVLSIDITYIPIKQVFIPDIDYWLTQSLYH